MISFAAVVSSLWLGLLTAIAPCPMTTNIAAIAFIGRSAGHSKYVILSGVAYALGRTVAYMGLGAALIAGGLHIRPVANLLQHYMNEVLGPILILAGMVLTGLVTWTFSFGVGGAGLQKRAEKTGIVGAVLLGIVFALSFCPGSAALFFAGLIPSAIQHESAVVMPLIYGLATAVPVVVFAIVLAFSAQSLGKVFLGLKRIEWWARVVTGWLFILVGIWYSLRFIFEVV